MRQQRSTRQLIENTQECSIRRAIKDGATLPVHYLRDKIPFTVDEAAMSIGYEQMCAEMEVEDDEEKDTVQRKRARWKELATHKDRVEIVITKILEHFLAYPDPNGFKAQLVAVDRKACVIYKEKLDAKLKARGLPPEWCDVIISKAQNSEPDVTRYEYERSKQEDLVAYFKQTPPEWEAWCREHHGDDPAKWPPPLKILIVCDRLLTGFDAPVEQVMYLDKPLRDHNLLQATEFELAWGKPGDCVRRRHCRCCWQAAHTSPPHLGVLVPPTGAS